MRALVLVFSAAACGFIATWIARHVAIRRRILNYPNGIVPQHVRPIAYLGGMGIGVGVAVTFLIGGVDASTSDAAAIFRFAIPSVTFLGIGLLDDILILAPANKFSLQTIAAALAVAIGNDVFVTGIASLDTIIAAAWILLLVNAFNVTDVCDGLLGGLATVSFLFLAYLMPDGWELPVACAGACLGFLYFNRPPASIFLGDAGSHLLGFMIASLTLNLVRDGGSWPQVAQVILLVGVPLFEVIFLVMIRTRKGIPWWNGSPDHFSLRLQQAGLSRVQTDVVAWSVAVILGLLAIILDFISPSLQLIVFALVVCIFATFGKTLLRWEVRWD
jgi:UDP-GlcNAc:undecaprenyl-phosphate/decaprenyl-phosphate GlcNAc-1-phosphate transferase